MHLQATALLVLLLTVLISAAPLSVESQLPPSILTPSNSTTSGDSQTSSNVPLPTIHEQTQESLLKLNDPDFPVIHSIIPPAASSGSEFPFIYNKQRPAAANSDLPIFLKRDVTKRGLPFIFSAQLPVNSAFPYGLNQDTRPSSDDSLPTVHDKIQESSLRSDFPVSFGVPPSPDSDFPFVFSEQKPAESIPPAGYKKRDTQPDLPTPDSELSYIHDAKSRSADSVLPSGF